VSTRVAPHYRNVGVLRGFDEKAGIHVVFELQNINPALVVALQIDFLAPLYVAFAPFWRKIP
jgi:hypothetical protein